MAREAVEKVPDVQSVKTDMSAHTVTVEFDDEKQSLDTIIEALNKAGYTVPGRKQMK